MSLSGSAELSDHSVLLASTSTAPFVQQAARAFAESGQLVAFLTTLVDQPNQLWRRTLRRLSPTLAARIDRQFSRRAVPEDLRAYLQTHSGGEWRRLLLGKLDRSGVAADWAWERAQRSFDRWAAAQLRPGLGWVYAFETGAEQLFRRAAALGIRSCYEVSAAEHATVNQMLAHEQSSLALSSAYTRRVQAKAAQRTAWRQREWSLAQRIVVYSNYCLQSYAKAGYDVAKVRVVHLAAPQPITLSERPVRSPDAPLALLWVGHFSLRKGAHLLLQAWRRAGMDRATRLDVYGGVELTASELRQLPGNIHLHGSVPHAELRQPYLSADALLFPSLSDSFGMVVTEALAHGCPVLASDAAGASEILTAGVDGKVIAAGNVPALVELLQWAQDNRGHLRQAVPQALATASRHSWSHYRAQLRMALDSA